MMFTSEARAMGLFSRIFMNVIFYSCEISGHTSLHSIRKQSAPSSIFPSSWMVATVPMPLHLTSSLLTILSLQSFKTVLALS